MSPPSFTIRPFRLSGRVTALLLVTLLGFPMVGLPRPGLPLSELPAGSAAGVTLVRVGEPISGAARVGEPVSGAIHVGEPVSGAASRGAAGEVRGAAPQGAARPSGNWLWPLPAPHQITGPFVAPPTRYAAGHRGIDIAAPIGATITSPDSGIVHFVGIVVDRPVLSIEHADGVISSFEPVVSTLVVGRPVARGDPIGVLLAGHGTEPSLHLGVRVHGEYVSPLIFLGGIRPAVLLPTRQI